MHNNSSWLYNYSVMLAEASLTLCEGVILLQQFTVSQALPTN